ncbi:MAG: DUF2905 domain-containing protein [Pseudomonadota bacterium]
MTPLQKTLILGGIGLIVLAIAWPLVSKLGLGRLPGDIHIKREGFSFYMPITTMVLLSIVVSLIMRWLGK